MKKSVMLAVMGLGMAAVSSTAYGQGQIEIGNYQPTYNAAVWDSTSPRSGLGVLSTEGVTLTLWFAEGAAALTAGPILPWHTTAQGFGFPGYYFFTTVQLPTWNVGDVFTFQVRASGNGGISGLSQTWTEQALITSSVGDPAPLPLRSTQSIGLVVSVPEPSTFALAGLGAAALAMFRRRSS